MPALTVLPYVWKQISKKIGLKKNVSFNPCSPEGFSRTYFPKGGVVATPPLDYQY